MRVVGIIQCLGLGCVGSATVGSPYDIRFCSDIGIRRLRHAIMAMEGDTPRDKVHTAMHPAMAMWPGMMMMMMMMEQRRSTARAQDNVHGGHIMIASGAQDEHKDAPTHIDIAGERQQ